jgi:PAS domain S-box-containing protein
MTLQYTPLLIPLLVSAAGGFGLGLYAWKHRRGREGVATFALLNFVAGTGALGDALRWMSTDVWWQYFWALCRRPAVEILPVVVVVFVAQYIGRGGSLSRRILVLLSVIPAIGIALALTNPWHGLIYFNIRQTEWDGLATLVYDRGPWSGIAPVYNYLLGLGGFALIVMAWVRSPSRHRGQILLLFGALLIPQAANVFHVLRPSPVDLTPMAMMLSFALLAWAIFRHRFLDMIPAAWHAIIEKMSDAMLVLDQGHRLVDLNPAAQRLLGRSGTAAVGLPVAEVLPESIPALAAAIAGTELRESEIALDGRDYELRLSPVRNKDGAVTGRVLLLHDITEQKRTRERLRQSVETSQVILESIEDGYYEIDLIGNMVATTDVTARIGGLASKEEAVGRNFAEFTDAASAQRLMSTFNRIYRTGEAMKDIEYPFTTPAGVAKSIEMSATVKRDATGKPIGFRGMLRDVTERRRAAEELARAKRTAEDASQAKGAFLATVSHELRTPLTSVLGFAKLIKRRMGETVRPGLATAEQKVQRALTQVSENVEIIVAEGERLTTLINEVLDLAKIESGKVEWRMQPVAVGEIIQRAIAATTSLSEAKGLQIKTEIEETLPTVIADPDRLIQVVINLLSNAIKFTDKGAITCRARRVDGAIEVSVTDTGTGIAPEDQSNVFEQFVQVGDTLTDKPTGTGLGLPICKQIVEHHGGRIWVESAIGHGSTFAFTLPCPKRAQLDSPGHRPGNGQVDSKP